MKTKTTRRPTRTTDAFTTEVTVTKRNVCTGACKFVQDKANGKITVTVVSVDGSTWAVYKTNKVSGVFTDTTHLA
jgi:hypothetical protein